ncbi:Protein CBG16944 [Caenorhabditis briggsae]|uniref:Uncharacterized protein n=2 Tax=Caenorhabditis briggsae TaxID=6238 RepID=A0AAE9DRR8_CAEBR|nr:Protein CBG16944 [Caenorhabditis briggsae]ULU09338.1 hypothetical protein L3Y34_014037 [Caenorhabditis briggsae]CAP34768.1 Protein CBG16944 [Caenorhabditis briggsae]
MDILTPSTTDDTDSPSSLTVETPNSGSQDQILPKENEIDDKTAEEERKQRRLERRKALALARGPGAPRLGNSGNNTIDLTNEDDHPSNRWFKKTFNTGTLPKKPKSPEDSKKFAVPRHIGRNAPKSLLVRETLQNKLKASMSVKRRKAQEERRKMYEEDNEHLKVSSEEEEEEEVVIKKKKTKKPEEEYNSEDDEDYKPPEEDSEDKEDDEMSVNLLNDSFTFDVFNNAKRSGPGSVFSIEESPEETVPTMSQLLGGGGESQEDLLNFCSGKFEEFPDTLQMLLAPGGVGEASEGSKRSEDVEEEEEEEGPVKSKKKSRILDSDDEEEAQESVDVFAELNPPEKKEELPETVPEMHRTRVVISEDEDSEEEEAEDVEEDPEDEEEPEEEEEEDNAPEPNFDDEDDELAVIKRIEHQEYKKQIKKRTLFDDEASLSGDDVGSDLEDEEGVENAYEAEEGDADDVPDDDTIRKQNFRMLLKQENDKETRALAKLQERLLADGDLGGVETNRQFRFKLREEMEVKIGMGDDGAEEQQEDEEPDEDEEKKKERAEMIKYRIEHAEELLLLEQTHSNEDDAIFARAGRMMMRKTEKVAAGEAEDAGSFQKHLKPSLLSKTALAVSFQEVLNSGGAAPKQMYVQNFDGERRQSSGLKRGLTTTTPPKSAAKRVRSSKLSSLE